MQFDETFNQLGIHHPAFVPRATMKTSTSVNHTTSTAGLEFTTCPRGEKQGDFFSATTISLSRTDNVSNNKYHNVTTARRADVRMFALVGGVD